MARRANSRSFASLRMTGRTEDRDPVWWAGREARSGSFALLRMTGGSGVREGAMRGDRDWYAFSNYEDCNSG